MRKRTLALFLAIMLVISMCPLAASAAGTYSDVPDTHWAFSQIEKWSDDSYGVLLGTGDGKFDPNRELTLAELVTILSKTFGYTEKVSVVGLPAWADEHIEKAVAAGIITAEPDDTVDLSAYVTREQAVKYIASAYGVAPVEGETAFVDNADIGAEYKGYVKAFQQLGYVSGKGNNDFDPKAYYTRAEALTVLDNTTSDILDESVDGMDYSKNVIIRKPGVTLKNTNIAGNLIIGQGVGNGDVHIDNVSLKGDMLVYGGGQNSLYLADFRAEGSVIVRKYDDSVRIVVSGASNFTAVVLETGAILVTQELADGVKINVEIPADFLEGSKFEFIGDFDHITNNGSNADITVTGSVNTLTLNESASVGGDGKIATAEISAEAGKDTSFATKPTNVTGDGKNDVGLPSTSTGGGNTGPTTPTNTNKNVASVAALTPSVEQNGSYTLPATVTATLSDNSTHSFAVTWAPNTVSTANIGTFEFEGTLTMTSGYANPNNVKAALTLTVTPVLQSIAVTPPAKVLYTQGEELELAGMTVMGTYSDGSVSAISAEDYVISGYDAETPGQQTVTVTSGGKTDTFEVTVYAAVPEGGELVSITNPAAVTVANGAAKTAGGLNLPSQVEITVSDATAATSKTVADVTWDVESASYDAAAKTVQQFAVSGTITLPASVTNTKSVPLTATINVTVSAAVHAVSFDLNGQSGTAVPVQNITHGEKATAPASAPVSASHTFEDWYDNADCTGNAWDFDTDTVTDDTVLYAKWTIKTYSVSFAHGTGYDAATGIPASLTVDHGSAAQKPTPDPSLTGFDFAGWFTDAACTQAYVWTTPVTGHITLYAKFEDGLSAAADALTFALIQGSTTNNPNEQSITTNLSLITGMAQFPGVTISWQSSNTSVISTTGAVTRPASSAADASVTLTATITKSGSSVTKTFDLIVRKQGTSGVDVTGKDARFAPGYPVVTFDASGMATVKVKLKPGVATEQNPVVAYYAMTNYNAGSGWTFSKESILYGHMVSSEATSTGTAQAGGPFDELVIKDDNEHTFTSDFMKMLSGQPVAIGIVLLADDDLQDPDATATVIQLTAEQAGYVDSAPPTAQAAVFNKDGTKIYAYFDEKIINTALNKADFSLQNAGGVEISSVTVGQNSVTGYTPHPSWAIVTLSGAVDAQSQGNVVLTYNRGASNIIEDSNSNKAQQIVWGGQWPIPRMIPGEQRIETYINPAEGTMCVTIYPAIWSGDSTDYSAAVKLYKDGVPVSINHLYDTHYIDGSCTEVYFTLGKDTTGSGTYTVSIESGKLTAFAGSAFGQIAPQSATSLSGVTATNVSATFDKDGNKILLTLENLQIEYISPINCSLILKVDGKTVLLRDQALYSQSASQSEIVLSLSLNERRAGILENGSNITIEYKPDAGGHTKDIHKWLIDLSGAYILPFGSVTVTKTP